VSRGRRTPPEHSNARAFGYTTASSRRLRLSNDAGIRAGDAGDRGSQRELAARLQHEKEHLAGLRDAIQRRAIRTVFGEEWAEERSAGPGVLAPARTAGTHAKNIQVEVQDGRVVRAGGRTQGEDPSALSLAAR
jgi:hypothetical protein